MSDLKKSTFFCANTSKEKDKRSRVNLTNVSLNIHREKVFFIFEKHDTTTALHIVQATVRPGIKREAMRFMIRYNKPKNNFQYLQIQKICYLSDTKKFPKVYFNFFINNSNCINK